MENWKTIAGFEGFYEVSDQGRVRSVPRTSAGPWGTAEYKGRILKAAPGKPGYPTVRLAKRGALFSCTVHRLVLLTFIGPPPAGFEGCHNNGVRTDCRLANLRWDTRGANAQDRHLHGTMLGRANGVKGEANNMAVLTADAVRAIRRDSHLTLAHLADKFGVSIATIHNARKGRTWKHVE